MTNVASLTSGADQAYFEGLLCGEIRLQFCAKCGMNHWPAVFHCADCGSWEHVWTPVSPIGKIYSWTRTWHKFSGTEGFDTPIVSLVVSMAEIPSVRLLGVLADNETDPEIGSKVTAKTVSIDFQGRAIPALSWSRA